MQDYVGDSEHRNPWIAIALALLAAIAVGWFIERRPLGADVEEAGPSLPQAPIGDAANNSPLRNALEKNIDRPQGSNPLPSDRHSDRSQNVSWPAWTVNVDPGADALSWPAEIQGAIPRNFGQFALFSSGPSAFVAIGPNGSDANHRTIWDLRTLRLAGQIPKALDLTWPMALSPDGRRLAGRVRTSSAAVIEICSLQDDFKTQRIAVDAGANSLDILDFHSDGRLLTGINTSRGKLFQVWNIDSAAEVTHFCSSGHVAVQHLALSPGRNYLALLDADKVSIFDLRLGQRVGEVVIPKATGFQSSRGDAVVFSPDGQELAVLCHDSSRSRLLCWKVASGEVTVDHSFSKLLMPTAPGRMYPGIPLEWRPDRSAWLIYGEYLIDYVSGGLVWQLPMSGVDPTTPRRLLGNHHLLIARNNRRDRDLQVIGLPRQEIAAASSAARAAQDRTLVLPPARLADWSTVRTIEAPQVQPMWNLSPDPSIPSTTALLPNAIPLNARMEHIQKLLFSDRNAGRAVVVESIPANPLSLTRRLRAEQVDLITGQSKGAFELFTASLDARVPINAVLSPRGTSLAFKDPREGSRLDVWSIEDRKHRHGWTPYPGKSGLDGVIYWLAFLDDDHLLTASGGGELTLWNVAQCRAIYSMKNCRGGCCISPGRRYLTFFNGSTFEFIDALSGTWRGRIALPKESLFRICTGAAFRPDGEQFAALFTDAEGRSHCAYWDLKQGVIGTTFSTPRAGNIEWCGSDQVLIGGLLVDLRHQIAFCNFVSPSGFRATNSPDGRIWFALQRRPSDPVTLNAQTLPDATALEVVHRQRIQCQADPIDALPKQCILVGDR